MSAEGAGAERSSRWLQRIAVALAACLALSAAAAFVPMQRGKWVCTLCAAYEERYHVGGLPAGSTDVAGLDSAWFLARLPTPHAHDWMPSGCHTGFRLIPRGSMVSCSPMSAERSLLALLPRFRDQELASRTLARMAAMSSDARCGLLVESEALLRVPQLVSDGDAPPSEDALADGRDSYAAWRDRERALADLFPAELP